MQLIDSSFLLLLIFLFLMFEGEGSGDMLETEEGTVRVIFYNVFEGMGGKDDGRVATLKSYISGFDVVGFSLRFVMFFAKHNVFLEVLFYFLLKATFLKEVILFVKGIVSI